MAESLTWGYGHAGTYGFRRPLVEDRWHQDFTHGDFLTAAFCKQYWVPFIKDGTVVPGSFPERPPFWILLLSLLKLKYIILGPLFLLLALLVYNVLQFREFTTYNGQLNFFDNSLRAAMLDINSGNRYVMRLSHSFIGRQLRVVSFTSFEDARADQDWHGIVQNSDLVGAIPPFIMPRLIAPLEMPGVAELGKKSENFSPSEIPKNDRAATVSASRFAPSVDVSGSRTVWLRFAYQSDTNPRPAAVHNCDSFFAILTRFDVDANWNSRTHICGSFRGEDQNPPWKIATVSIPVPLEARSMELAFSLIIQNNPLMKNSRFLIDDVLLMVEAR